MPSIRFRCVCFTLNNPEGLLDFDEEKMAYLVYQEEIGDGSDATPEGTFHFQGYCEFKNQYAMAAVKAMLGGDTVHIEARRGTQEQAIAYCKKDDTRVGDIFEHGQPREAGKRNDLVAFKDAVRAGKRKRELFDDHLSVLAKYPKLYDALNSSRPERDIPVEVILLVGPTGLGKTRYVYDKYKGDDDLYVQPISNGTTWWDMYDGHHFVLIDDFAGKASHMHLTAFLKLIDRWASLVPTKGGHTWFFPTHIYVTTNILPKDWWSWDNRASQYLALARRFTSTILFTEAAAPAAAPASWWKDNCPGEANHLYPFELPAHLILQ